MLLMEPVRSKPPFATRWRRLLSTCTDGRWYLANTYSSRAVADQMAYKQRRRAEQGTLPPGRWEFAVRRIDSETFGVWVRNLAGPLFGTDE